MLEITCFESVMADIPAADLAIDRTLPDRHSQNCSLPGRSLAYNLFAFHRILFCHRLSP